MAEQHGLKAALALGLGLVLTAATPAPAREQWFELVGPAGEVLGYQHETEAQTPQGRAVRRERYSAFRVDGHGETRLRQTLERHYHPGGGLVRFRFEQVAGAQVLTVEGVLDGGTLTLVRLIGGRRSERRLAVPGLTDIGDPLAFAQEAGTRPVLSAGGLRLDRREVRLVPQGDGRVLRLGYVEGRLDSAEVAAADALELPQLGFSTTLRRVPGPLPQQLRRTERVPHEMWKSPFYVPQGALRGQIRYRFAFRFGFAGTLPQTGEQAARPVEGGWQIDVCARCGPGLSSDPAQLEQWRRPNPWIQSDAPEIAEAVRPVLRRGLAEAPRMAELARLARERLTRVEFDGYYPARSAWRSRSGDCTEDALVLAALARAAGIPARVASGLAYSRTRYHGASDAFMPHAWVVAWVDGRWQSFDISLEGFDATHVALSLSDGEPGGYIEAMRTGALLDFQGMSEVRKRN